MPEVGALQLFPSVRKLSWAEEEEGAGAPCRPVTDEIEPQHLLLFGARERRVSWQGLAPARAHHDVSTCSAENPICPFSI